MVKRSWQKWAVLLSCGGAILLQTPACAETATVITSLASVVTAGGVIYIITRIME